MYITIIVYNCINFIAVSQVTNVQVFQYHPFINDRITRNVLVTWNNVSEVVSNFTVRVIDYSTGMDLDVSNNVYVDYNNYFLILL